MAVAGEVLEALPASNKDARAAGVSRYFTGAPCIRGHISVRAVGGTCVACKAEDGRSEKNRIACKSRYHADKEPYIERAKRWVNENRQKAYAAAKKWDRANPEVKRACVLNRRAKIKVAGGISGRDIKVVVARQKGKCASCGEPSKLAMDHIMPLALGGDGGIKNIQGLCAFCNGSKGAKHPIDFNRSRGLLL